MENEIMVTLMIKYQCPETGKELVIEPDTYVISVGDDGEGIYGHFTCPECGEKHDYKIW